MVITTMIGREFNRDVGKAKRQAVSGPVVITSRGRAAHMLLAMEEYVALRKQDASIADILAMPKAADIEFDPPRLPGGMYQPADQTASDHRDGRREPSLPLALLQDAVTLSPEGWQTGAVAMPVAAKYACDSTMAYLRCRVTMGGLDEV